MKKIKLSFLAIIFTLVSFNLYSSFQAQDILVDRQNNCDLSVNLGFVKIWTGSITLTYTDANGELYTVVEKCGKNNGSWDWFWE